MSLNLYLLTQDVNTGWDTYDSAVVAAKDEEAARNTQIGSSEDYWGWADPSNVKVQLIGKATKDVAEGVIVASYNAG